MYNIFLVEDGFVILLYVYIHTNTGKKFHKKNGVCERSYYNAVSILLII